MKTHPALASAIKVFQHDSSTDWRMAAMGRAMLRAYHHRWLKSHNNITVLATEATYTSSLVNPVTGRTSRKLSLAGKLDKVAEQDGKVLFDHKTTSEDIEDPASNYWRLLAVDTQPKMYELLLGQNGLEVERIVWDVARKPRHSPRRISTADCKQLVATCEWFGSPVTADSVEWAIESLQENAELFECRLYKELKDNTHKYFQRRSVPRGGEDLLDFAGDLWETGQRLLKTRKTARKLKNPSACLQYGRPCQFLGICSGHDRPDSARWQVKKDVHVELGDDVRDGRDVITNSRLRCYLQCEVKHYYQYEKGIQRTEDERTDALYFGTLWHLAMDAWWAATSRGVTEDVNSTEQPVYEVGTSEQLVAEDQQEVSQAAGNAGPDGQAGGR